MFAATALLYPCVLAVLCIGAGLLLDRACGARLPAVLLASVGAAVLIAVSQLLTFVAFLAPATPYALALVGVGGALLCHSRLREIAANLRRRPALALAPALVYALALAPVLIAGRPSFSSYMALADSAVHIMGADYLLHHGQSYTHLDLRNSYGQFINNYYNSSYPSGADTLFGGSAELLGLPLIWAFQPFNAFMLATAWGPAWLLARRLGARGAWAVIAAVIAVVPALVYAYELLGSIKEITALSMLLASGCLVTARGSWAARGVRGAIPLAVVLAGGISALGIAFGVWALAAALVLAGALVLELRGGGLAARAASATVALAALVGLIAALPTWSDLSGSLQVAGNIASTSNPGNLHTPLRAVQALGVWLGGSYKLQPAGASLTITHALIAVAIAAALAGAVATLLARSFALAAWLALVLLAWLVVTRSVTTWASAKTLMLTSPVVVLLAWGGVAAVRRRAPGGVGLTAAALLALALGGGVLVSDAQLYHSSNLAPTARYEELSSLDSRFAGRGPTLFTDFDEYSLYELRRLDVGGPDFVYPPPAVAAAAGGYGNPVRIDAIAPAALRGYPLIVTRRDPTASRPPAAYALAWQGAYYQVWRRRPAAPTALEHRPLAGSAAAQCRAIGSLAGPAAAGHGSSAVLVAAEAQRLVAVDLAKRTLPSGWGRVRAGVAPKRAGRLTVSFQVPSTGIWRLWAQAQMMPTIRLAIDGRAVASIGGELSGNSLVVNTAPPVEVPLAAGRHTLTVSRGGATLAAGDGGAAFLDAVFLTSAATPAAGVLREVHASDWRSLCGRRYEWVELLAR